MSDKLEKIILNISNCANCGYPHQNMELTKLLVPVSIHMDGIGWREYHFVYTCFTNTPVLVYVRLTSETALR